MVDKKEHLCVGFTPDLGDPIRRRGGTEFVHPFQEDALGLRFDMVECGNCHAWAHAQASEAGGLACEGCGKILDRVQSNECRVPVAFRTNFKPLVSQEEADSGVRHRSIQAEGKALQLSEQSEFLSTGGAYRLGFDETTTTFRLNRGPLLPDGKQAFEILEGQDTYPWRNLALPAQVVSSEARLLPERFEPKSQPRRVWLAAPKTTDATYLLPSTLQKGLALHRLPSRSDNPPMEGRRWLGVRAAALSATYLLVNRASLELDIDPGVRCR